MVQKRRLLPIVLSVIIGLNAPVKVEACTNLANPIWAPLQTNTLTGGSVYFTDPDWPNHPARFYRVRWP